MLNINIKATNTELTSSIRDYIHEKYSAFEKVLKDQDAQIFTEIGRDNNHHNKGEDVYFAKITMTVGRASYKTQETAGDLYVAIDKARSEIMREVKQKRGRAKTMLIRGARKLKKRIKGIKSWSSLK